MPNMIGPHPSDEEMEHYAMYKLPEEQAVGLEEHLIVCAACRARLEEFDDFTRAMRSAASQLEQERAAAPSGAKKKRLWLRRWPVWLAWSGVLLAVLIWSPFKRARDPLRVELESWRGGALRGDGALPGVVTAPAGRRLLLVADITGLPGLETYQIELVDRTGSPVTARAVSPRDGRLSFELARPLHPDRYWVRLHGADGTLLREFGLQVR